MSSKRADKKTNAKKKPHGLMHQPTRELEIQVQALRLLGRPDTEICKVVGLSQHTLKRHYRHILKWAPAEISARLVAMLVREALRGDTKAAMYLLERLDNPNFKPKEPGQAPPPGPPVPVVFELPADDWEVLDGGPSHLPGPA